MSSASRLMKNMLDALNITREEPRSIAVCPPYSARYVTDYSLVEEKYGKDPTKSKQEGSNEDDMNEDNTDSSSDEEEDDEGFLASGLLDDEVNATLEAIRRKDPRVYDEKVTFYTENDNEGRTEPKVTKVKPMSLHDYHRQNLLKGATTEEDQDSLQPTYTRQQDELKLAIVQEMHTAANHSDTSADSDASDNFLVKKRSVSDGTGPGPVKVRQHIIDIEGAEKDPDTFLSNFMSARAWIPASESKLQPFESDDEEEDLRAEAFEEAYNLRFENPQASNEKLLSHARDTAAKYSVRKEAANLRKRAREANQAKRSAEKLEQEQERARLRKLKKEEAEDKIKKIKVAAGLRGKSLGMQDWSAFLTEDWEDDRWELEMRKRFGEGYYADHENDDSEVGSMYGKQKLKKPKWDDDIKIKDLVPEFDSDEEKKARFSLSDESDFGAGNDGVMVDVEKLRSEKREDSARRRELRKERRKIEQLVDEKINLDLALEVSGKKASLRGSFRYRETSPLAYGLTTRDILMASDSQLNQYAGLKKMAPFRDADKKKKDKRHLGKKARLRQWRKDTFGDERGPEKSLQEVIAEGMPIGSQRLANDDREIGLMDEKRKKRKRSRQARGTTTLT